MDKPTLNRAGTVLTFIATIVASINEASAYGTAFLEAADLNMTYHAEGFTLW